jgi:adenylosuccinate synthase
LFFLFPIKQADGLQEQEKGGKSLGTTKKGIGPTYSSKATRNGIRIADLLGTSHNIILARMAINIIFYLFPFKIILGDSQVFSEKLRTLVAAYQRMLPDLNVDIEAELEKYKGYAEQVRPFVVETISYLNGAVKAGKTVLVEGANAAMLDIDFGNSKIVGF